METARFDTRLSKDLKERFEYAATLGGYKSLYEFVILSAREKDEEIMEKHNLIVASKKDQKIFCDALLNPPAPNKRLTAAARRYSKVINAK